MSVHPSARKPFPAAFATSRRSRSSSTSFCPKFSTVIASGCSGSRKASTHSALFFGSVDHIPEFIKKVKSGEGGQRLMGFGHRVYKNYDPRARIIKTMADQVFEVTGRNPLLDIALELERIALQDEYFVTRKLYPNVDFYSGLIYQAMGFPVTMFPVLFAIPRTAGWIAQWEEMLLDPDQKISRPRQVYIGSARREYVPPSARR